MVTWRIEPLASPHQIDDVLSIEEASFTNPWTREMYLADLENRGISSCFLAQDDAGRVVGFCSVWRVADELHINNLAVRPEFRRMGVATALPWLCRCGYPAGLLHQTGRGRAGAVAGVSGGRQMTPRSRRKVRLALKAHLPCVTFGSTSYGLDVAPTY
jgi:GNAT superfamily N-acetyltransferase